MLEIAGYILLTVLKTIAIVAIVSLTCFWSLYAVSSRRRKEVLWEKWLKFGHAAGAFNSRVILTLFYWLVVTPYALVLSLSPGFDPLRMRRKYTWIERETRDLALTDSLKQS